MSKIKMKHLENLELEQASDSVFNDLGLSNSAECLVKADLVIEINKLIKKRKLKQVDAAKLLGLDQPKISDLSRGRLAGFSVERLFRLLAILNQDIEIIIRPHHNKKNDPMPYIHVRYANA